LNIHKLKICQTCHRAGRFLNIDTPTFTNRGLSIHSKQHPNCLVCPFIAFDAHELNFHMTDTHIRCNVCAKHDKIIWFATIEEITEHNRNYHFQCEDHECIAKGLAFDSDLELQMHYIAVHGKKIASIPAPKMSMDLKKNMNSENWEKKKRHKELSKKIAFKANALFDGNKERVQELLMIIDLIDYGKINPKEFLSNYHKICADLSEALFTDTVSAISDYRVRTCVIRLHDNYRIGKPVDSKISDEESANVTSDSESKKVKDEFPSISAIYTPPKTPKPARPVRHTMQKMKETKFQKNGGWASVNITASTMVIKGKGH
jgi:hypothetical protein